MINKPVLFDFQFYFCFILIINNINPTTIPKHNIISSIKNLFITLVLRLQFKRFYFNKYTTYKYIIHKLS